MPICAVEILPLDLQLQTALTVAYGSYPVLNYALVRLYTTDGRVGLGEASPDPEVTGETQAGVLQALAQLKPVLVGAEPAEIGRLLAACRAVMPGFPAALAAVDMALFDLLGQALQAPVYQLLGGKAQPAMALYPVIPLDEAPVMAELSARFAAMGARTLKIKLGTAPEEDYQRLQAIRAAVGGVVKLRLDINQGWRDAPTAIAAIRRLEGFNIEYIEQPVAAGDLQGLAEVARAVELPVMADESCHTAADVLKIACRGAADMINIKLMKCGGIYAATQMLAVAEAAGLPCILGSMGESSIGSAAGLHFAAAHASITACELIGPLFITNDPASGFEVDLASLCAIPSERPGLGVNLRQ